MARLQSAVSYEACLGRTLLPNTCGCWQNSLLLGLLDWDPIFLADFFSHPQPLAFWYGHSNLLLPGQQGRVSSQYGCCSFMQNNHVHVITYTLSSLPYSIGLKQVTGLPHWRGSYRCIKMWIPSSRNHRVHLRICVS